MNSNDTINALIRQFAKKGGVSMFERTEDTIYQGVIISFCLEADASNDAGDRFDFHSYGHILATARGGNYISVFGAGGTDYLPPTIILPEDWKLYARHDSCWTDGPDTFLREIETSLKAECPDHLSSGLKLRLRLNSHPSITMVELKMPSSGEEFTQLALA